MTLVLAQLDTLMEMEEQLIGAAREFGVLSVISVLAMLILVVVVVFAARRDGGTMSILKMQLEQNNLVLLQNKEALQSIGALTKLTEQTGAAIAISNEGLISISAKQDTISTTQGVMADSIKATQTMITSQVQATETGFRMTRDAISRIDQTLDSSLQAVHKELMDIRQHLADTHSQMKSNGVQQDAQWKRVDEQLGRVLVTIDQIKQTAPPSLPNESAGA